jgi:hypothetical protein
MVGAAQTICAKVVMYLLGSSLTSNTTLSHLARRRRTLPERSQAAANAQSHDTSVPSSSLAGGSNKYLAGLPNPLISFFIQVLGLYAYQ